MIKKLKTKKFLLPLLLVFIIVVSYGQTLRMNFYQDDAAVIFKLQHIKGPAGSYGSGPFGEGPYKYTITPFIPFYQFFGLNPFGYFLIGFLLYIVVTCCFYIFAKQLLENKKSAYFSALIFASGLIGSNSMTKISNSWQNNIALICFLLLFFSFIKFLKSKNWKFYLLSLGIFLFSVEFIYIRSHSLIFPILILDLLITFRFKLSQFIKLILRQTPFFVVFYFYYIKNESTGSSALGSVVSNLIQGKVEILSTLFATVGNVFVSDSLQNLGLNIFKDHSQIAGLVIFLSLSWIVFYLLRPKIITWVLTEILLIAAFFINKFFYTQNLYWYRNTDVLFSGSIGMYSMILIIIVALSSWKKYRLISLGLLFGLFDIISQLFGYFIQYPEASFSTTHRYLFFAFVGYSIVLGSLTHLFYMLLKIKKSSRFLLIPLIPLTAIVLMNAFLSFHDQKVFVENISIPTHKFYETLKKDLPSIKKGSVLYFDISDDSKSQTQFKDFFSVGSMPNSTAISIYYGIDRYDFSLITDYDELLSKLHNTLALENLHTFYFDHSTGLADTTEKTSNLLKNGSNWQEFQVIGNTDTVNLISSSLTPFSPILLDLKIKVSSRDDVKYPIQSKQKIYSLSEKRKMIKYLLSRLDYYSKANIVTLSEWKYQEKENILDNNLETSWRGHRIYWHDHQHEQLTVDLGEVKNISKVYWVNWIHSLTPTTYTIQGSIDNKNWQILKKVNGDEKKDGELVENRFDPTLVRFIRMDITGTLSNDAPAISEFEVVETNFIEISQKEVLNFIENPFNGVQDQSEMDEILSTVAPFTYVNITLTTDKSKISKQIPIGQFNMGVNSSIILKPGGKLIKEISVSIPYGVLLLNIEGRGRNISLDETSSLGAIKNYREN